MTYVTSWCLLGFLLRTCRNTVNWNKTKSLKWYLLWLPTHFVDAKLSSQRVCFWQWESSYFSILWQPRAVAGFRGTVRYASINAHRNRVSISIYIISISCSWKQSVIQLLLISFFFIVMCVFVIEKLILINFGKG